MMFNEFSEKQATAMMWWKMPETRRYDAIVCDGSVRSGKTMSMATGFVLWSGTTFNNQVFGLCGKTVGSLLRNVVTPMQQWLEGIAEIHLNLSRNCCYITVGEFTNTYYLFGGKDESSAALIQGITLAGVFFDEVALMPKSFVDQALARCSVKGARMWFNCNPESPAHWFYDEWVDDESEKVQKKNRLHLHFTMDDNLSLTKETKERYERLYTGTFRDRYILGLWVAAEGIVYTQWAAKYVLSSFTPPEWCMWYISMDYGTVNPCSMGLWCVTDKKAVRVAEYYYDSRKIGRSRTDEEHYAELVKLADGHDIQCVIVDPSAASFIECIRRHGQFNVRRADNDVLGGIRRTQSLIGAGAIEVCECCKDILREFSLYRWDEDARSDAVIKENDHAMDDMRYLVNTVLKNGLLREVGGEFDVFAE